MKIVLTGGGTAGHVMPNLALVDELSGIGYEIHYIGSRNGIERSIVTSHNIKYHSVRTGKLRRYFDLKNFIDPFNIIIGIIQSFILIRKIKPVLIFSKGGFVAVPVIIGAWLNRIPSITHEGDISVGLANKLCLPFVKKICTAFQETTRNLPQSKAVYTGLPIRKMLLNGSKELGCKICGFSESSPVILVMGGSLGSLNINKNIRNILPELLKSFQVVHICGKGNVDNNLEGTAGYKQFEFIGEELPHILAAADIAISRAGTNSVFELITLTKVCLFIPLSTSASRGEQVLTAKFMERTALGKMLTENNLTRDSLLSEIEDLYKNRETYIRNLNNFHLPNGTAEIIKLISEIA
ncbi:MAG: undecaprenyldiphospho-muramoylpentapeptide beta-N-acetylglucosaminyltransferase [Bacteroidota bacterium]|nr:undecaprenyldiphospho-muramoylpentapeptide beta-N-acetylglucosaminyltransferase [Bacteroidota bacterium]